jgi:hypothetical protein
MACTLPRVGAIREARASRAMEKPPVGAQLGYVSISLSHHFPVTPGLDPGVPMDCRVKPGNDGDREVLQVTETYSGARIWVVDTVQTA